MVARRTNTPPTATRMCFGVSNTPFGVPQRRATRSLDHSPSGDAGSTMRTLSPKSSSFLCQNAIFLLLMNRHRCCQPGVVGQCVVIVEDGCCRYCTPCQPMFRQSASQGADQQARQFDWRQRRRRCLIDFRVDLLDPGIRAHRLPFLGVVGAGRGWCARRVAHSILRSQLLRHRCCAGSTSRARQETSPAQRTAAPVWRDLLRCAGDVACAP